MKQIKKMAVAAIVMLMLAAGGLAYMVSRNPCFNNRHITSMSISGGKVVVATDTIVDGQYMKYICQIP